MKGVVYVSPDEGKSWKPADGVPEGKAAMVIEHPYNNRVVSVSRRVIRARVPLNPAYDYARLSYCRGAQRITKPRTAARHGSPSTCHFLPLWSGDRSRSTQIPRSWTISSTKERCALGLAGTHLVTTRYVRANRVRYERPPAGSGTLSMTGGVGAV